MSDRAPTMTVLMTAFNAGKYLSASIRSICQQAFQDWELLVVDDASTDGSADVASEWAAKDQRIRVIRNDVNKGQTPCLNQGLRVARGKWIARQDADDLSHPLRLTRQFERASRDPALALLGTCGRIIDSNDKLCGLLDVPLDAASVRWCAALLNPFLHTSVMFRKDVVLGEFGGYDENFLISQDYDLWTRMIARYPSANLPARLVCYRNLASALSKTGRATAFDEARAVSERTELFSFGRELGFAERELASAFREGRPIGDRRVFWNWYNGLQANLDACARARLLASHHLKLAGSLSQNPAAALAEVLAAFRSAPGFAANWLAERMALR